MESRGTRTAKSVLLVLIAFAPPVAAMFVWQGIHDAQAAQAEALNVYGPGLFRHPAPGQYFDPIQPFHPGIAEYAPVVAGLAAVLLLITAGAWWTLQYKMSLASSGLGMAAVGTLLWAAHNIYEPATTCFGSHKDDCPIIVEPMGNVSIAALVVCGLAMLALFMAFLGSIYRLHDTEDAGVLRPRVV
jgi:multisubunit Na+/H+ antiporter MnhC subunit